MKNSNSARVNRKKILRTNLEAYTFVLPLVIGLIAFFLYPLIFSFAISLGEYKIVKGGNTLTFIGLGNYANAIFNDVHFRDVLGTTIKNTLIETPLIVIFSMIFAVLLNNKVKGIGIFRTVFFLPFLLGTGYIMKQLLGVGVVDQAVSMARSIILPYELYYILGPKIMEFLTNFVNQVTMVMWRSGVQTILFLSALQSINTSLYEAARVDSATEWEIFWKITFPMVSPMTLLVIVYTIIDSFTASDNLMLDLIRDTAFKTNPNYSFAAAMSWMYFAFILLLLGLVFAILKTYIYVEFSD